jgi:hypothetical protein
MLDSQHEQSSTTKKEYYNTIKKDGERDSTNVEGIDWVVL